MIKKYLPNVKVVSMYAAIRNIMSKTDAQLVRLKNLSVNDLYVGVESGLEDILEKLNKGNSVEDVRRQCDRLNRIGIRHMALLMLGAAGKGRGIENAIASAALLNDIKPTSILINTMTAFEGTALAEDIQNGAFTPAGETEILTEEKFLIENLDLPESRRREMIEFLDAAIENMDEELFNKTFKRTHI